MRYSKCAPSLPLTYQLSPRSGASGYQNRVHKKHEHQIICPLCPQLHAFLSDRLITWGKPAQRVIGTLPNSSAHTLAIWQPAPWRNQNAALSPKAATIWQSGKLAIQPKHEAYYGAYVDFRAEGAMRHWEANCRITEANCRARCTAPIGAPCVPRHASPPSSAAAACGSTPVQKALSAHPVAKRVRHAPAARAVDGARS